MATSTSAVPPRNDFPDDDRAARVVVAADRPLKLDGVEFTPGEGVPLALAQKEWDEAGGALAVFTEKGRRLDRNRVHADDYYELSDAARDWYDVTFRNARVSGANPHMGLEQMRRWFAEGKR